MNSLKRLFVSLCCILTLLTFPISVFAAEEGDISSSNYEYGTSVTYDVSTGEISYGANQIEQSDITSNISEQNGIVVNSTQPSALNSGPDLTYAPISDTLLSPYRNVCYISAVFPNGDTDRGSGVLVYKNVLLTSGHMVYQSNKGGWAQSMQVIPARNGGSAPLGMTSATNMTTNNAWVNNADEDWDWAIVDLADSYSTWQIYGYYNDYNASVGNLIEHIGYPLNTTDYYMYHCSGYITKATDRRMYFDAYSTNGFSGGAIIDSNSGALVGISRGAWAPNYPWERHDCVRINEDLFNRISMHIDEKQ